MVKSFWTNQDIKASQVHLINEEGKSQGIVSRDQALLLAYQKGYDLVQVSSAYPPVCRLVELGKYKYELEKKEKKIKKKSPELKEIRMKLSIEPHDLEIKKTKASHFLAKGHKTKITVILKGREMVYTHRGFEFLEKFKQGLGEEVREERKPERLGNRISVILSKVRQK